MAVQEELTWRNVIVRVGLNALTHPFEYSKVLIQIGHEPLAPYKSRTFFGREKMFYPNVFKYIAHIKHTDGFFGCYRGLGPKLVGNVVSGLVSQKVTENITFADEFNDVQVIGQKSTPRELTVQERTQRFVQNTARETAGRTVAIVCSQPFHVIAVRTMSEFVGNDDKYTGVFTSIAVVYREEGVKGFFCGLVPRILCDIGAFWIGSVVIHVVNNYLVEDNDIKGYIRASVRFMASALMYPFQVVANCMAVTGSGLAAGHPPNMPVYVNWCDCYKNLRQIRGLKRGSSLLWRAYSGPVILGDQGIAIPQLNMFKAK